MEPIIGEMSAPADAVKDGDTASFAADVIEAGFHETAFRYRNQNLSGSPQYCALYETSQGGFEAFKALMLHYREQPSPVADFCVVRHVWALEAT